ncbi:MAG: response regulator [Sulfuricurvum sp.]|nr:response regulator [Sulfuricurvum sp.]
MQNKIPISVLIVDDEPIVLALLNKMLGKKIQDVYSAANGEEALFFLKNTTIDVIISDFKMPLMDGIELLKQVRAIDTNIPFILCTALAEHDALINAIEHGISSILSKPINPKKLFEKIEKVALDKEIKKLAAVAMQVKDDFLANMSHEIRTPMNAILGFIPLIQNGVLDEKQKIYMNILERSAQTLLEIVNNVLDFSKLASGKFELDPTSTNFSTLLHNIGEIFAVKIEEKQIQYILFLDPFIPKFIKIDDLRLQQILSNLMSNAIKFTPEYGKIELSSHLLIREAENFKIRISVKDTGIGIKDTDKNKIFNAFSQADNSISRKFGGTGLGLSISSNFVTLMESKLCVESIMGQGSEFYFDVWVALSQEHDLKIDHSEYPNIPVHYKVKVLLAEDNAVNQILFKEILSLYGIVPDVVENGEEAVKKMNLIVYDLIFMDINMPIMDGVTALKIAKIQKIKAPIIALTANTLVVDREKFLHYGFSDYLTKPIDFNEVQRVLFKFLHTQK